MYELYVKQKIEEGWPTSRRVARTSQDRVAGSWRLIEWSSRQARADIRALKAYIAKDSPYYPRRFTERVIASIEKLKEFPKIGRPVPEAEGREDVRELIYQGYRIIYLI